MEICTIKQKQKFVTNNFENVGKYDEIKYYIL